MDNSIHIRPMRLSDIEPVMQVEKNSFEDPWSESAYITEISNSSAYYTVLCVDDLVVGVAGMWIIMDEAHITNIAVDPSHRRKKLGERLLIDLLETAVQRGARRATLEVRESNIAAQNLYKKYGFSPVAMRRRYYSNNDENAIIMWANKIATQSYIQMVEDIKKDLN